MRAQDGIKTERKVEGEKRERTEGVEGTKGRGRKLTYKVE